jgi:hypothetical protein
MTLVNDGERYRNRFGLCPKGLYLQLNGINPAGWDNEADTKELLRRNIFINEHLTVWLQLSEIEKQLRDKLISSEEAEDRAYDCMAKWEE